MLRPTKTARPGAGDAPGWIAPAPGGATSTAARWMANRENTADVVGGVDPCGMDRDPKGHLDAVFGLASAAVRCKPAILAWLRAP